MSELSPRFSALWPHQRLVDRMYAGIKEDVLAGCVQHIFSGDRETAKVEIPKLFDRFLQILEDKVPETGFVQGLDYPTVADLAVLNTVTGFMPFGAAAVLAGYDLGKWKKVAALAQRVQEHKHVAPYWKETTTTLADPYGLRKKFAGSV
eukprot:SRR837773.11247.p1 GENE.SRR837773.11247~~SRR837773.11247.p1  ORF type:complete len:159 (+),score=54.86 SRR837773.11247:33-479(+)